MYGTRDVTYVLHASGSEEPSRLFLLTAGIWQDQLHEEVWIFNQGFWRKDHALWVEVQKGNWKDVILDEKFKVEIQEDIYGFFDSEPVYKRLAIPWKVITFCSLFRVQLLTGICYQRGIIMYGPPGNGKTISIKVIIKECVDKGFNPLYVKSFVSYMGEEGSMEACSKYCNNIYAI